MKSPFAGMTREQIQAELAKERAEKASLAKADARMNHRILRVVRPGLFSKEHLARIYLKSKLSLVGIEGEERTAIQQALVEFQGDKQSFVDAMAGKYDRSEAQWEALFDNEMHQADEAGQLMVEARKGKTTKSWVLGDSKSGPCDECVALSEANQDVPIDENYSNDSKIASAHPGCCCSSVYSDGGDDE